VRWSGATSLPFVGVAVAGEQEPVVVLGLDAHQPALRPVAGDVGGQVDHALRPDDDVLRSGATLHPHPAPAHRDRPREGLRDLGLVGDDQDRGAEVVAEAVDQSSMWSRSSWLSWLVGSSASKSCGALVTLQASASRCRSPPDIDETTWSPFFSRPTR
jgi:hypothetical protein